MFRIIFIPFLAIVMIALGGCSRARNSAKNAAKSAASKTGQIVGEHVGAFFAGVGEGVEKMICDYGIEYEGGAITQANLSVSLVRKTSGEGKSPLSALSLYVLNEKPVSGNLQIRFVTSDGREIGRGTAELKRDADGAGYVRVPVDADMPTELVAKLALSLLPDHPSSQDPSQPTNP
jgi:hypothetical protein